VVNSSFEFNLQYALAICYALKLLQNKLLRSFISTHQNRAMPRIDKPLFYCTFNAHYHILIHNPGLMYSMVHGLQIKITPFNRNFAPDNLRPFTVLLSKEIK